MDADTKIKNLEAELKRSEADNDTLRLGMALIKVAYNIQDGYMNELIALTVERAEKHGEKLARLKFQELKEKERDEKSG